MKIVEKIKGLVSPKPALIELFEDAAKDLQKILNSLYRCLEALCKQESGVIEKKAKKTISDELHLHDLYHKIIQQMYTRETMNFSREDRQYIANQLLEIGDSADFVIRRLRAYRPNMSPILGDIMLAGIGDIKDLGKYLKELVRALFNNFEKAKNTIWEIHHIQRNMWVYEVDFLEAIYTTEQKVEDIIYYEILMRNLRRTILIAVRFADGARKLILKYTL